MFVPMNLVRHQKAVEVVEMRHLSSRDRGRCKGALPSRLTFKSSMPDRSRARLSVAACVSSKLWNSNCRRVGASASGGVADASCARSSAACVGRLRGGTGPAPRPCLGELKGCDAPVSPTRKCGRGSSSPFAIGQVHPCMLSRYATFGASALL
jgi:hypothetical protein